MKPSSLARSLVVAAVSTVAFLAVTVAPASAALPTLNNGNGGFTAVSLVSTDPSVQCATYSNYQATLVFPNAAGSLTANVRSGAGPASWGEFADGTYTSTTCKSGTGPGAVIGGFTGTLTGTHGSQVINCTLKAGTGTGYKRGKLGTMKPELNVRFTFTADGSADCGGQTSVTIDATIPSVDLPTPVVVGPFEFDYLAACNSPIAPQSCMLRPATFT